MKKTRLRANLQVTEAIVEAAQSGRTVEL